MISFARTNKIGALLAIKALNGVPVMMACSIRSKFETYITSQADRIIYDLEPSEYWKTIKLTDTTHVIIIPSRYLQDAQIAEMVHGITIPWQHLHQRLYSDCFAYESDKGDIIFKLPLMRKPRRFEVTELQLD